MLLAHRRPGLVLSPARVPSTTALEPCWAGQETHTQSACRRHRGGPRRLPPSPSRAGGLPGPFPTWALSSLIGPCRPAPSSVPKGLYQQDSQQREGKRIPGPTSAGRLHSGPELWFPGGPCLTLGGWSVLGSDTQGRATRQCPHCRTQARQRSRAGGRWYLMSASIGEHPVCVRTGRRSRPRDGGQRALLRNTNGGQAGAARRALRLTQQRAGAGLFYRTIHAAAGHEAARCLLTGTKAGPHVLAVSPPATVAPWAESDSPLSREFQSGKLNTQPHAKL